MATPWDCGSPCPAKPQRGGPNRTRIVRPNRYRVGGTRYGRRGQDVGDSACAPRGRRFECPANRAASYRSPCAAGRTGSTWLVCGIDLLRLRSHFLTSHFLTCHFLTCHFLTCHFLTCHFLTCHFLTCHFLTCHFLTSHFLTSHFLTSHFLTSHFLTSHFLTSHFLTSHFLTSHFLTSHFLTSLHPRKALSKGSRSRLD
ncbi:hypothetical protein Pla52o_16230 [Novipirellula galeiformis]|uniref:Uncharacterized protein n=1 Tax=Novipirellula galeiformis TaxID=2528004 RepID=A0A5C6CPC5_9BACT|nr:hypothetical protein Pla52o_16230 [Novipirellula galeiformis]